RHLAVERRTAGSDRRPARARLRRRSPVRKLSLVKFAWASSDFVLRTSYFELSLLLLLLFPLYRGFRIELSDLFRQPVGLPIERQMDVVRHFLLRRRTERMLESVARQQAIDADFDLRGIFGFHRQPEQPCRSR